ncbi:hypothetical protein [Streptomyces sp. NPDC051016]|uniref:hypothetical protein n=1 Tax=Streptomyces sp. NPDC051016 TaxID=3365638 RepID=UPI00379AB73C
MPRPPHAGYLPEGPVIAWTGDLAACLDPPAAHLNARWPGPALLRHPWSGGGPSV